MGRVVIFTKMRKCQACVKLNLHLMFDQFMTTYSWLSQPRGYYILTSPLPEISSSLVTCVARFPKFTPVPWVAAWTGEVKQPRLCMLELHSLSLTLLFPSLSAEENILVVILLAPLTQLS